MTQRQVDLRKEQEQLSELEIAPLTYFMTKEQINFKVQKNGFNLNIKPGNVIKTASSTNIKTEQKEKEEIVKNNEKLNQKIKKCNQRKENLLKILMKTQEKWQN